MGDWTVLVVTVFPLDSMCEGSYVVFVPLRAVITILTGMITAETVVEVFVEGADPTML
jgi:hypothetical protein